MILQGGPTFSQTLFLYLLLITLGYAVFHFFTVLMFMKEFTYENNIR